MNLIYRSLTFACILLLSTGTLWAQKKEVVPRFITLRVEIHNSGGIYFHSRNRIFRIEIARQTLALQDPDKIQIRGLSSIIVAAPEPQTQDSAATPPAGAPRLIPVVKREKGKMPRAPTRKAGPPVHKAYVFYLYILENSGKIKGALLAGSGKRSRVVLTSIDGKVIERTKGEDKMKKFSFKLK